MYIVIIGGGRSGKRLVERLLDKNNDLLLIDRDEKIVNSITDDYGIPTVLGDGADPVILRRARVHKADYILIVTGEDKENLAVTMMVKKIAKGSIIVKANDERFISILEDFQIIDKVISPPKTIAQEFEIAIRQPEVKQIFQFDNHEYVVLEMVAKKKCKGIGKPIEKLSSQTHFITALMRRGKWIPAANNPTLQENDTVLSLTHKKEVKKQIMFYRAESRLKKWLHFK